MNILLHIDLFAVILGTISFVIAGSMLYNPIHKWGQLWSEWSGMGEKMKEQEMTSGDMIFTFGGTILGGVLLSLGLNHVTYLVHQSLNNSTWMTSSLITAFFMWIAFFGVATFVNSTFAGASKKLVGLHMINGLIELLLIGVVIGFFPF